MSARCLGMPKERTANEKVVVAVQRRLGEAVAGIRSCRKRDEAISLFVDIVKILEAAQKLVAGGLYVSLNIPQFQKDIGERVDALFVLGLFTEAGDLLANKLVELSILPVGATLQEPPDDTPQGF